LVIDLFILKKQPPIKKSEPTNTKRDPEPQKIELQPSPQSQPEPIQRAKPQQQQQQLHPGGLLKLNTEALNQMKATQEAELMKAEADDDDEDVKQYVKGFRNLKYSGMRLSKEEASSGAPQKMLFNPNNPDKPIYVQDYSKQKQQNLQPSEYSRQQQQQQQSQKDMSETR
jgi:hypothetical protein